MVSKRVKRKKINFRLPFAAHGCLCLSSLLCNVANFCLISLLSLFHKCHSVTTGFRDPLLTLFSPRISLLTPHPSTSSYKNSLDSLVINNEYEDYGHFIDFTDFMAKRRFKVKPQLRIGEFPSIIFMWFYIRFYELVEGFASSSVLHCI